MDLHKDKFAIPGDHFIGGAASKLYKKEALRTKYIKEAATEQGVVMGHQQSQFWTHSLPFQLYGVLDSFERGASEAAAIGFLKSRGYVVTNPAAVAA